MSKRSVAPRTATFLAAAGLAVTLLAGCGGSSGGSNTASQTTPSSAATTTQSTPSAAGTAPANPDEAKAQITANWEKFFNQDTPPAESQALLQNAGQLQQALAIAAKAKQPGAKQSAKVKDVTFKSPTEATVTYDLLINGTAALSNSNGTAVLENGTWKVSQTTFCTLVSLAASGQSVPGCGS